MSRVVVKVLIFTESSSVVRNGEVDHYMFVDSNDELDMDLWNNRPVSRTSLKESKPPVENTLLDDINGLKAGSTTKVRSKAKEQKQPKKKVSVAPTPRVLPLPFDGDNMFSCTSRNMKGNPTSEDVLEPEPPPPPKMHCDKEIKGKLYFVRI